jgi:hypothetical protein
MARRRFGTACGAAVAGAAVGAPLTSSTASAQPRSAAITVEDPYLIVVRQSRVHKELELNKEQTEAIQKATDEIDGPLFLLRDLPIQQRVERSAPLARRVRDKMQQTLSQLQQQRLAQIVAQSQGHRALLRDEPASQLRLSVSQRNELLDIAAETEKEKTKLNEKVRNGGSRRDAQEDLIELMTDERKKFVAALNTTQEPRLRLIFGASFQVEQHPLPHFKPPKMPLPGPWINSEPLTLDKLKGKVVALHFYAFA